MPYASIVVGSHCLILALSWAHIAGIVISCGVQSCNTDYVCFVLMCRCVRISSGSGCSTVSESSASFGSFSGYACTEKSADLSRKNSFSHRRFAAPDNAINCDMLLFSLRLFSVFFCWVIHDFAIYVSVLY